MNSEYKKSIINYYDNTKLDYRLIWFGKGNRSVHFGYYDDHASSHFDALLNLNRVMAKKIDVKSGDTILDAGCGQGNSSVWLATNFDVNVTGITLVPHQVKIARNDARKHKLDHKLSFDEQDYTNTKFEDGSFTVVWACESMCHAESKSDFYKEAFRLLKPGGRLICADYFRLKRDMPSEDESLLMKWLNGWSIKDIDTHDEHKINAENIGFAGFKLEDITKNTKPSLRKLHSRATRLWKLGKFFYAIGLRNKINHGNQYASIKQFQALEKGLWFYGLLSMTKPVQ
jgi:cyclopropane fatty-acyl-phospholipid synthase-like methyltransferase